MVLASIGLRSVFWRCVADEREGVRGESPVFYETPKPRFETSQFLEYLFTFAPERFVQNRAFHMGCFVVG